MRCKVSTGPRARIIIVLLVAAIALGQPARQSNSQPTADRSYTVGPGDQLIFRVINAEEIGDKPILVDLNGSIQVPVVGRLQVGGSSISQIEELVRRRLESYLLHPDVSISVAEFRSQPVSVIGAVRNPGIHQVQGSKTLIEVLSLAGGLDTTAGSVLTLTRRLEFGRVPLPGAADDATGRFSIAEIPVSLITEAKSPENNIFLQPYDVVSVAKGRHLYVLGQVVRSGEYPLQERESVTLLQALSMAGGLDRFAKPQHTRILRRASKDAERVEVRVDVSMIMAGKASDVALAPEDIVVVPNNAPKRAALRALEAAVEMGTGFVIWRR